MTWGFVVSRLSESNRRPSHYESDCGRASVVPNGCLSVDRGVWQGSIVTAVAQTGTPRGHRARSARGIGGCPICLIHANSYAA